MSDGAARPGPAAASGWRAAAFPFGPAAPSREGEPLSARPSAGSVSVASAAVGEERRLAERPPAPVASPPLQQAPCSIFALDVP